LALTTVALGIGCSASSDGDQSGAREVAPEVEERAGSVYYYVVTRQDFRKCAYPHCGGVYVKRVNRNTTKCLDGSFQPDCYVADIDLSELNLGSDLESETVNVARMGQVVIQGSLTTVNAVEGEVATLAAQHAWRAQALTTVSGSYYLLSDSGIVCITTPCPTINEAKLNTAQVQLLGGLDLTGTLASQETIDKATASIFDGGLVVAGTHKSIQAPGGGKILAGTEFFTPVKAAEGEPCGNVVCGAGQTCCNASCSMCVPEGMMCIQIACEPEPACVHSECDSGDKLDATCSSCASKVCEADPFCCDTAWDSLCVSGAASLCGGTCAPAPETCAHNECDQGDKLDATCSSCAGAVCDYDPYCCSTGWDSICVSEASSLCGLCN
jgi:hypothetical protein